MNSNWTPIGFKKPSHETATLKNFLSLLESRYDSLHDKLSNPDNYNLDDRDCAYYTRELEVLEQAMTMAYDLAHRGYDIVIQTNYAKGN